MFVVVFVSHDFEIYWSSLTQDYTICKTVRVGFWRANTCYCPFKLAKTTWFKPI